MVGPLPTAPVPEKAPVKVLSTNSHPPLRPQTSLKDDQDFDSKYFHLIDPDVDEDWSKKTKRKLKLKEVQLNKLLITKVISLVMMSIWVYAHMTKHTEAALAHLSVDPAMLLMIVGVLMFLITFCGCVGSLRENICLLQTFCIFLTLIFLLQLAAGVLGFVFSDKARAKVTELINNAVVHYRDDIDLQNLIDFGQKEFGCCGGVAFTDWDKNMYFNCTPENPSRERCSVPFSCCHQTKGEVINTMCGENMQNVPYVDAGASIHTNGCIDELVDWIHGNLFLLGGVALGLAIPQLVGILLSQILINQTKDQIELQNYNRKHRSDLWR